ncbi:MAG: hypothetical protein DMG24_03030 [Acidobacteria bacterium]|nr:MAG: hypothetical protein DMG24_03030 [Acidobacteriota bacterium]
MVATIAISAEIQGQDTQSDAFDLQVRGIGMALGATRAGILGMVARETFVLVTIGIAAGIGVALAASRLVSTFLYRLKPNDPLTIAGAVLLMVAAAALAGYVPARRASKVDPMGALRYE